jgi:CheY-like chemotaxis protein
MLSHEALEMVSSAKNKKIPVIVLSKSGFEDQLQKAFELDIEDYVSLPLSLPELSLRINKINRYKQIA